MKIRIFLKDGNEVPDVPSGDLPKGILPQQIEFLVASRSEVKKVMKQERNPAKYRQVS